MSKNIFFNVKGTHIKDATLLIKLRGWVAYQREPTEFTHPPLTVFMCFFVNTLNHLKLAIPLIPQFKRNSYKFKGIPGDLRENF